MLPLILLALVTCCAFACPEYPDFNTSVPNGGGMGFFGPWSVVSRPLSLD